MRSAGLETEGPGQFSHYSAGRWATRSWLEQLYILDPLWMGCLYISVNQWEYHAHHTAQHLFPKALLIGPKTLRPLNAECLITKHISIFSLFSGHLLLFSSAIWPHTPWGQRLCFLLTLFSSQGWAAHSYEPDSPVPYLSSCLSPSLCSGHALFIWTSSVALHMHKTGMHFGPCSC